MKQVVIKIPSVQIVELQFVDVLKFYGVESDNGLRAIARASSFGTNYNLFVLHKFTDCNSLGFRSSSLKELLTVVVNKGYKVYEFDKLSELALWVERDETNP